MSEIKGTVVFIPTTISATVSITEEVAEINYGLALPGAKGDKGDKGDTGATGATGAKGDSGQDGLQGSQGLQGLQGEQGAKGDTGLQGIRGEKGDKGDAGNSGYTPIKNVDYFDGAQGIQGIQGVQGVQGEKGENGSQGLQGERGLQGVQGDSGIIISTLVSVVFENEDTYVETIVVGLASMTADTKIIATVQSEEGLVQGMQFGIKDIISGVGFTLMSYAPDGATGTFTVNCIGG